MEYRYRPSGVCSREMIIELDGNIIKKLTIVGGCAGNTVGVPDSRDLFYILKERELTHQELAEIGRVLRRFFAHDVVHTDLNIHNILLSSTGKVSLIDFDRCRQTLLREAHKKAMLERLERSFAKEMRKDPKLHFKVGDFEVIKRHALKKEN